VIDNLQLSSALIHKNRQNTRIAYQGPLQSQPGNPTRIDPNTPLVDARRVEAGCRREDVQVADSNLAIEVPKDS